MPQKLPPAPRRKNSTNGTAPRIRSSGGQPSRKAAAKSSGSGSGGLAMLFGFGGAGIVLVIVGLIVFTRANSSVAQGDGSAQAASVATLISPNVDATTGNSSPVASPTEPGTTNTADTATIAAAASGEAITVEPLDPSVEKWLSDFPAQSAALRAKVAALDQADISRSLRDPALRRLRRELVRHEILRQLPAKDLQRFLKTPEEQAFLGEFLSQTQWIEQFVGSGSFAKPLTGLLSLTAIALHDADVRKPSLEQRIATSVALETAASDRTPVNAVEIYDFYRDRGRQGKLHPGFATLDVWEMRFAVAATVTVDELTWIGNRASFSPSEARSAAWQVHYLGDSPFGDTIQSASYYMPWAGSLNYTQKTCRVGGVCGSLSTTGALSAKADGIPATTMGEPGHCAFAVRPARGQWVDGNSVDGNHRTPHRNYFEANWADLFAGDQAWMHPGLREAQYLAWAAETLPKEDLAGRSKLFQQATLADPYHYGFQATYFDLLQAQNVPLATKTEVATSAVKTFQLMPETSWLLIKRFCKEPVSSEDRIALQKIWLAGYSAPVADQVSQMPLDKIIAEMGQQRGQDQKLSLFGDILQTTISNEKMFARFLDACQKFAGQDASLKEGLLSGLAAAAQKTGSEGGDTLKKLCRQGILLAEETSDKEAFKALSELGARFATATHNVNHKAYSGELLSAGGIPRISSTCRYDEPLEHAGLLKETGGRFHTDQETNPAIVVELGKQGTLSGLAIVNIDGQNSARAVPFKVSVSIDGKNWQQVFKANKNEKVWQIDLGSRRPLAKYVRIEGDYPEGRKDFLHLHGIYVYGKPAQ